MTAQICDLFYLNSKIYSYIASHHDFGFEPSNYGLKPKGISTACYKGYWCEYEISKDSMMLLKHLIINSENNKYPPINGVQAFKNNSKNCFYNKYHIYENIHLPIYFTGKILLGNDFLHEHYTNASSPYPWSFNEIKTIEFENGVLVKIVDHSNKSKEMRKLLKNNYDEYANLLGYIRKSFIRDCFLELI